MREAAQYCREGQGPALVHAKRHPSATRIRSPTTSGCIRPPPSARTKPSAIRSCISRAAAGRRHARPPDAAAHHCTTSTRRSSRPPSRRCRPQPPARRRAATHLYSPDVDPTLREPSTPTPQSARQARHHGRSPSIARCARRCGAIPGRGLRRGRRRLQPRGESLRGQGQRRRVQSHGGPADASSAARASSTRRSPKPRSSAARSAWRRAG